jgi:hypothetical protein
MSSGACGLWAPRARRAPFGNGGESYGLVCDVGRRRRTLPKNEECGPSIVQHGLGKVGVTCSWADEIGEIELSVWMGRSPRCYWNGSRPFLALRTGRSHPLSFNRSHANLICSLRRSARFLEFQLCTASITSATVRTPVS